MDGTPLGSSMLQIVMKQIQIFIELQLFQLTIESMDAQSRDWLIKIKWKSVTLEKQFETI